MTQYFAEKTTGVARYDIPASLAREVGRFLVTWAHFEHYVQAIVWNTLRLGPEEGRMTVREPRVIDRLDIIRDLATFQNLEMDYVLLRDIKKRAEPLAGKRHLLAHSIWMKFGSDWCCLDTRGAWEKMPFEIENYPKGSRMVQPQSIPITAPEIRAWSTQTADLIEALKKIGDQHRLLPSPERQPKRSSRKSRRAGRND